MSMQPYITFLGNRKTHKTHFFRVYFDEYPNHELYSQYISTRTYNVRSDNGFYVWDTAGYDGKYCLGELYYKNSLFVLIFADNLHDMKYYGDMLDKMEICSYAIMTYDKYRNVPEIEDVFINGKYIKHITMNFTADNVKECMKWIYSCVPKSKL